MEEVISKTLKIQTPILPPDVDFIEKQIESSGIEALRWEIVDIKDKTLTLSVSGRKLSK